MFDLLLDDTIIKIFNIRCDDIEKEICKLEKMLDQDIFYDNLYVNDNTDSTGWYDKCSQIHNLQVNGVDYDIGNNVCDVIHYGLVRFIYINCEQDEEQYNKKISGVYSHPMYIQHLHFITECVIEDEYFYEEETFGDPGYRMIECCSFDSNHILTNKELKNYEIVPEKINGIPIVYIEAKLFFD